MAPRQYKKYARKQIAQAGAAVRQRSFKDRSYSRPQVLTMVQDVAAKEIKRVMFKGAETKRQYLVRTPIPFNGTVSGLSDLYNVIPDVQPGTGNNARVGEKITPTYLNIRGYCYANDAPGTTIPNSVLDVELFFLMDKVQRDGNVRDGTSSYFIRTGAATIQHDGTMLSSCSPVDTDRFHVVKRIKCKLIPFPQTAGQLNNNSNTGANNYEFNITVPMSKLCPTFDYSTGNYQPTNCNMFMTCAYAQYMNPSTSVSSIITFANVGFTSTLYYKDM